MLNENIINKLETIRKNHKNRLDDMSDSEKIRYYKNFGIDFTYNSAKIEGSSLTKDEVRKLLGYDYNE